jgi:DNA-binding TFAR19-related protein (PDSD5 family)
VGKIRKVEANNRKAEFRVVTGSGTTYVFPYAKAEPRPESGNKVEEVVADRELANEAFTYVLESGDEGTVHLEQVLEYNEDPGYLSELLIYKLTLEARKRAETSGLSRRELARRLGTSVPQLYRLLDPANARKSMNQMVSLLQALDCDVDVVVRDRRAARR